MSADFQDPDSIIWALVRVQECLAAEDYDAATTWLKQAQDALIGGGLTAENREAIETELAAALKGAAEHREALAAQLNVNQRTRSAVTRYAKQTPIGAR